jgi:phosphopantetheinyl transferase (holo-ACP synthase)
VLHGAAAALAESLQLVEWSISLSHTREHAIAFVVARG